MRVIAGTARGHNLQSPDGLHTRPTADRIKEAIFNILSPDIQGCSFLDLFAGTGGIGIEALSRGADDAIFVDNNVISCQILRTNLAHTKLDDRGLVLNLDCLDVLYSKQLKGRGFDIIFMDPPYGHGYIHKCLRAIVENKLLSHCGRIVCEQESKSELPECEGLSLTRVKEYKTTNILFFCAEDMK